MAKLTFDPRELNQGVCHEPRSEGTSRVRGAEDAADSPEAHGGQPVAPDRQGPGYPGRGGGATIFDEESRQQCPSSVGIRCRAVATTGNPDRDPDKRSGFAGQGEG